MHQSINYNALGEIFSTQSISRRSRVTYRRFDTAALAIQFAVEELPADTLRSATLAVSEHRFAHAPIQELYSSPSYPLKRRKAT